MTLIKYTFVGVCAGGGHTTYDVEINGDFVRRMVITTDDIRAPIEELSVDDQTKLLELALRGHLAGKTRQAMQGESQGAPMVVTL